MPKYYMFNKPAGCVTARRDAEKKTVMDYFPEEWRDRLHPIGRLDLDTEGLLIVTDDGRLDNRLNQPDRHVSKRYYFRALGHIGKEEAERLEGGIELYHKGIEAKPAVFEPEGTSTVLENAALIPPHRKSKWMRNPNGEVTSGWLTITEGKKHQVKLMIKSAGCRVFVLKREQIGGLRLDPALAPGAYRELTADELAALTGNADLSARPSLSDEPPAESDRSDHETV